MEAEGSYEEASDINSDNEGKSHSKKNKSSSIYADYEDFAHLLEEGLDEENASKKKKRPPPKERPQINKRRKHR